MWKDIRQNYQVSNNGQVKSLERFIWNGRGWYLYKEKILIPVKRSKKNPYLCVYINGKNEYVHQLVAEAFIPNPENKRTINHKDGNKLNNNDWNLEYSTHSEQMYHAYKNKLRSHNKSRDENGRFSKSI